MGVGVAGPGTEGVPAQLGWVGKHCWVLDVSWDLDHVVS